MYLIQIKPPRQKRKYNKKINKHNNDESITVSNQQNQASVDQPKTKPDQQKPKPKKAKNAQQKQVKKKRKSKENQPNQKQKRVSKKRTKQPAKQTVQNEKPRKRIAKEKKIKKARPLKKLTRRVYKSRRQKKESSSKEEHSNFKAMIYNQQSETQKQDGKKNSSNQSSQGSQVNGQVKEESLENKAQNNSRTRQSQIAMRLHAYRDELQIMEIESEATRSCDLDVKELAIENDTPTDDQIQCLLQLLREKYSHIDQQTMVEMLYRCLIKKDSKGNDCRNIQEELLKANDSAANHQYSKLIKNLQGNLRALTDKTQKAVTKNYTKNSKNEGSFQKEEDWNKFSQKQIVARAFCNREYGINALLEQIRESGIKIVIDKNHYKTLVIGVVNEAYRKLEDFLMEQCGRDIKPLNRQQIKAIETTLLSCRMNFGNQQCLTFLKFMKLTFQLQSVTITDQAAMKLYIVIQRALKLKLGEMQLDRMYDTMRCNKQFKARRSFQNQKFQIHRIWNNEIETEFLNFYKQNQEFARIRDYFKTKYIEHQHLFTIDSLRSRFNKIMRMALRKTSCFCEKFGQQRVPHMIKLNDKKAKFLLKSPKALNARLLLVDMYIYDECDIKRLYQTVSAVNEFVIMKDNERMNRMIEAEPLFNSATAKIAHNVTITKNKMKTKTESGQEIYYKGKEMNYDHIVQKSNGHNLHYYRKPNQIGINNLPELKGDIKFEDQVRTSVETRDPTAPTYANRIDYQWMDKQSCFSREDEMLLSQNEEKPVGSQVLEKMIREEMERYNKKAGNLYSIYR